MNEKKNAAFIIIGVLVIWAVVIALFLILRVQRIESVGDGKLIYQENEDIELYSDEDIEEDLYDTGYVMIVDDTDILAGTSVISLKGHVYLPEVLTRFIEENGFKDVDYVTVVPNSYKKNGAYSIFAVTIANTERSIEVTFDNIAETYSLRLL